jgi:hypothetical protein
MRLTLQEMVSGAIAEADMRTKLAQAPEAEDSKGGKGASGPGYESGEEEEEEGEEGENGKKKGNGNGKEKESKAKCASAPTFLVEKVASAIEFIGKNIDQINWEKVAVGEGIGVSRPNAPTPMVGPAVGPGSDLMTNMESPTPGMQSTDTGQAKNNQPPVNPGTDPAKKTDGQTNAATALETDMTQVPGGTGVQPTLDEPGNLSVDKKASIAQVRRLWKMAADAENPAKIDAGPEPLENPDGTASEENVPKQPGAFEKQRNMIDSNQGAIDYTKGQAKAEPKAQMGEVLTEPAQKKSTDPVLHNNLDAASTAGVKLSSVKAAAARRYLRKIAEAGEKEDASPEEKEKAQKLKEMLAKKNGNGNGGSKEKESQMMGAGMGSAAAPMGTTQTGGML